MDREIRLLCPNGAPEYSPGFASLLVEPWVRETTQTWDNPEGVVE
jgi:hypothetical protein